MSTVRKSTCRSWSQHNECTKWWTHRAYIIIGNTRWWILVYMWPLLTMILCQSILWGSEIHRKVDMTNGQSVVTSCVCWWCFCPSINKTNPIWRRQQCKSKAHSSRNWFKRFVWAKTNPIWHYTTVQIEGPFVKEGLFKWFVWVIVSDMGVLLHCLWMQPDDVHYNLVIINKVG